MSLRDSNCKKITIIFKSILLYVLTGVCFNANAQNKNYTYIVDVQMVIGTINLITECSQCYITVSDLDQFFKKNDPGFIISNVIDKKNFAIQLNNYLQRMGIASEIIPTVYTDRLWFEVYIYTSYINDGGNIYSSTVFLCGAFFIPEKERNSKTIFNKSDITILFASASVPTEWFERNREKAIEMFIAEIFKGYTHKTSISVQ